MILQVQHYLPLHLPQAFTRKWDRKPGNFQGWKGGNFWCPLVQIVLSLLFVVNFGRFLGMDPYMVKERTSFWKPTENAPEMDWNGRYIIQYTWMDLRFCDFFWGMDFFRKWPAGLTNRTFGDKVGSRIESLGKLHIVIEYKPFVNHSTVTISTADSCVVPSTAFVGHVGYWYYKKNAVHIECGPIGTDINSKYDQSSDPKMAPAGHAKYHCHFAPCDVGYNSYHVSLLEHWNNLGVWQDAWNLQTNTNAY